MHLKPFFQWCDTTAVGEWVRNSRFLFPAIETIHLLALTVLLGSVLIVNLRLLGAALRSQPVTSVARALAPLTFGSLVTMLASGSLLFASEAMKCFDNPPFWVKMQFLFLAIVFQFTFVRSTVRSEQAAAGRGRAVTAALVSLTLWFGVAAAGRAIGFY